MATYGRRKGNLMSFSIFQGETHRPGRKKNKQSAKVQAEPQVHEQVDNQTPPGTNHTRDFHSATDSIDELANALLSEDTPGERSRGTHTDVSPMCTAKASRSVCTSPILDKPLPLLPLQGAPDNAIVDVQRPQIPAKDNKSNTAYHEAQSSAMQHSETALRSALQNSSSPLSNTDTSSSLTKAKAKADQMDDESDDCIVRAGTGDLTKRLSLLMQDDTERTNLPAVPQMKRSKSVAQYVRLPRLKRSREAFARAKKAITERLSSSVSSIEEKRRMRKGRHGSTHSSSSPDEIIGPDDLMDNDANLQRLNRRLAEGANLSNQKVKALIGDGKPRRKPLRKPLPVYTNLTLNNPQAGFPDDPFSRNRRSTGGTSSPDFSDLDAERHQDQKNRRVSAIEPLLSSSQLDNLVTDSIKEDSASMFQFSDLFSGLRQHQDLGLFSSSPVGFSTPRYRLEPQDDMSGRKRLSLVPVTGESAFNPSIQKGEEEQSSEPPGIDYTNRTLSLKRKTAKTDNRVGFSPAAKKAKTQETQFAVDGPKLDRSLTVPLASKDKNQKIGGSRLPEAKRRGLKIFQLPKGKANMRKWDDNGNPAGPSTKEPIVRVPVGSTDAAHRRRASTPALGRGTADDSLSVDELQME
ncbi:hypothetical protein MMC13_001715 [Lambiella insularis]|nr:hypothetical protein [Lambiella insularis]